MIDVTHQITSARRQVGTRVLEAGEARVVTISQFYAAEVEDVWEACTDAERIPRWFLPVSGELKVGGRFQLEGNAGGVVEACDPPRSFQATWEYGGEVSWIELTLVPEGDGTRFELRHIAHVDDERWAEFGPGAVGIGWEMGLIGLSIHLSGGEAVDPAEAMAWSTSPEGRRFMTESSELWCAANIAAGTPEAEARAQADRTLAAYTAS
ncbi:SRPBCC family protein [Actinocorallia aurantiaca]|uniref:SRPBCC family protein n=1 Tax=Actinocorallia aurantiaca TaxID=46204 RepID=A0ABN3USL8_9ACTN